ncbi:MAG: hypothetical protein BWK78_03455 [Thiotrichaceae bacterium IS1]|nr:MAG: hypothetical protein BWK78_03455 [Thiotrichaceae bacterium IS1]
MPSLTMTSIPEDLYQQVLSLAQSQQHSLEEFTIILLRQAVQVESTRLQQLLMTMKRDRFIPPPGAPNSLELLQEVRQ